MSYCFPPISSVLPFVRSSVRSFFLSFIRSLIFWSFVCSFSHLFILSFVCSFILSYFRTFVHRHGSFIHLAFCWQDAYKGKWNRRRRQNGTTHKASCSPFQHNFFSFLFFQFRVGGPTGVSGMLALWRVEQEDSIDTEHAPIPRRLMVERSARDRVVKLITVIEEVAQVTQTKDNCDIKLQNVFLLLGELNETESSREWRL